MAWEDRPYYREDPSFRMRFGFTPPTPVAMWIMIACLGVFVLQAVAGDFRGNDGLTEWLGLTFRGGRSWYQPWRWITYHYLHGSAGHIFFNLIGIYFLVPPIERLWGSRNTLLFYTAGGVAAGALYAVMNLFLPFHFLVGASGSIFACLGALALLMPEMQIMVFFVFPMSIRLLALLLGLFWFLVVISSGDASAAAHLGGLAFGFAAPYWGKDFFRNLGVRMRDRRRQRQTAAEQDEQQDIDRILQKVHDTGMNSLSRSEKKALARATERQRQADLARARRTR